MNLRAGDAVSAVALVVESETTTTAATLQDELPIEIDAVGDALDEADEVSEDTTDTPPEVEDES